MNTQELLDSRPSYIAQMNTLGHAIVIETLKMAAYYLSHSNGISHSKNFMATLKEAKSCYMFVQGTGLQITLDTYDLNYNSDRIRNLFNYFVRHSA